MKCSLAVALAAFALLPSLALAQVFHTPTFYVWGNVRPAETNAADHTLVNMIMLDSYGWF